MSTTTNPIGSSSMPAAGLSNTPANMQITQAGFLQLITAQMKDQNPLSPSDPTQFVTQLEGMSQVSAMQSMQGSLQAQAIMTGTSLIGRSVLVPGKQGNLATGGAIGGSVTAPAGTTKLSVSVQNAKGQTVNTFSVNPADSGMTYFAWKGTTDAGTAADPGTYSFSVTATVDGKSKPLDPNVVNKVGSVLVDPATNAVEVQTDTGNTVPLTSIISVM